MNQDGASNGLTAPNGPAQQRVIRSALVAAGVGAGEVDVVEAHGTGTRLGDPIEAQALLATYGQDRDRPLLIGSVKSNIGHTQSAAGVAGVIKTAMAMRYGRIPASLHVDRPTEHVDWSEGAVEVADVATEWPETGRPRRAGVSAFGVSGTNAHVVLEQAPDSTPDSTPDPTPDPTPGPSSRDTGGERPVVAWPLAAADPAALAEVATRLRAALDPAVRDSTCSDDGPRGADPIDVARSLAGSRAALEHRAIVVGSDPDRLREGLDAIAGDRPDPGVVRGHARGPAALAVLFSGQGAQRAGTGRELDATYPVFARALDEVCAEFDRHLDRPLREVVLDGAEDDLLDDTGWTQPALFALEVALFRLVESWGVEPDHVAGHSIGEIVAAHVAGVLSLPDAVTLVAARARLMRALPAGGAMIAIAASEETVASHLAATPGAAAVAAVAAVNGPASVVLAGADAVVTALAAELAATGVRTRRLRVSHAFHSPLMEPMLEEFRAVVEGLHFAAPRRGLVSMRTADAAQVATPEHWVAHVRDAVRFADGLERLTARGVDTFLELGPGGSLTAMAAETLGDTARLVPALRPDRSEETSIVTALACLHAAGVGVDWVSRLPAGPTLSLPTYPFRHTRFWPRPTSSSGGPAALGQARTDHPLVGAVVALAHDGGVLLTGRLSRATHPWLADHVVGGAVLVPGTAFVELAVRAGDEVGAPVLEELTLQTPLVLPERDGVAIQLSVGAPDDAGLRTITVHSRADGANPEVPWVLHAQGVLAGSDDRDAPVDTQSWASPWPPPHAEALPVDGFYRRLTEGGYGYGPAFQGLTGAWRDRDVVYTEAELAEPDRSGADAFGLHPALLDAGLHGLGLAAETETETDTDTDTAGSADLGSLAPGTVRLPFSWRGARVVASGATRVRVRLERRGASVRITVADPACRTVAVVDDLILREVDPHRLAAAPAPGLLLRTTWIPADDVVGDPPSVVTIDGPDDLDRIPPRPDPGAGAPDEIVVLPCSASGDPAGVRAATSLVLGVLQRFTADDRLRGARLVVRTSGAVGEDVTDLAAAAARGLVRSAQTEDPGRFVLLDSDGSLDDTAALVPGEDQVLVRDGEVLVPRLVRVDDDPTELAVPTDGPWRVDCPQRGTLAGLATVAAPEARAALGPGQVRLDVRAAGVNFRDVLIALGRYPGDAVLGSEAAGVVTEVGPEVADMAVGDRVFGMVERAFGPEAVADHRLLARMPASWSYVRAAAVPAVFLTAHYALRDLAGLRPGQTVLVHSGAGGVGTAAVMLARLAGAEVYATASPGKWDALRALGLTDDRIASSRTLAFEDAFRAATGGAGFDVVLDALSAEFVEASLRLMPRGGTFLEMGKADVRDPAAVAAAHPGVDYHAFDLGDAGPQRIAGMLGELLELFATGGLAAPPIRTWDLRRAPDALRFMSRARHVGKVVLTVAPALDPDGVVLVTGASGTLGAQVARHLAVAHGVRHLVLASRRGPDAPGADELLDALAELGAQARCVACDVADRAALAALLEDLDRPLTGVVHAAGVVDDGVIASLDDDRLDRVLAPKADGALHLHELTRDRDLALFVLFSSFATTVGGGGQGNYAAANAVLDAIAAHRATRGHVGQSLGWGPWAATSAMTEDLDDPADARRRRGGLAALPTDRGLALLDAAIARPDPVLAPVGLDLAALRSAGAAAVPPVLRGLAAAGGRRILERVPEAGGEERLADRVARVAGGRRRELVLDVVVGHVAAVLGHGSPSAVDPRRPFQEMGFDSLTAVELRNRLAAATGESLPPTLIFEHPTPDVVTDHLLELVAVPVGAGGDGAVLAELERFEAVTAGLAPADGDVGTVVARLRELLARWSGDDRHDDRHDGVAVEQHADIEAATTEDIFALVDHELGAD